MYFYLFSTSLRIDKYFNHGNAFVSDQQQVTQTLQHEHQQIFKQLQIHCPHKSVNQTQPAAERTDVLYDFVSDTKLKIYST